jgi:hypothetical protein
VLIANLLSGAVMRTLPTITMLATFVAFVLAVPSSPHVAAAESAETSTELEEIRRLIGDLGGETRNQRIAAEKRLLELGPRVLPSLPAAELLPSNSVRESVRRIRRELERRQARDSVLPSRVTFEGQRSLAEILAEVTCQTGNLLDGRSLPAELLERQVELHAAALSFWQVVDDLSDRLKLHSEFDAELRGLKLLPAVGDYSAIPLATAYAGAFRIEAPPATRLARSAPNQVGAKVFAIPRNLLRVTLQIRPEPRLRPLFLQFAANEITVRTADNRELAPFSPDANYDLTFAEGAKQSPVQLDYASPDGADAGPLTVTGKMRCTAAAGNETFRFAGINKADDPKFGAGSRRRGGVTVSLTRVQRDKRELRIRIAVAYESGGPAFESHRTWFEHKDVYLEDSAGKRFKLNGGNETVHQGEGTLGIEYRFVELPDPLPELTFVYACPTLIIDVPIEFEIKSVPATAPPRTVKIIKKS